MSAADQHLDILPALRCMLMGSDFQLPTGQNSIGVACFAVYMIFLCHHLQGIACFCMCVTGCFFQSTGQLLHGRIAFQCVCVAFPFFQPADQPLHKAGIGMFMFFFADQYRTVAFFTVRMRAAFLNSAHRRFVCEIRGCIASIRMRVAAAFHLSADKYRNFLHFFFRSMFLQCTDKCFVVIAEFIVYMPVFFRYPAYQVSIHAIALFAVNMGNKRAAQGTAGYIHRFKLFMVISPAGFCMHMLFHTADQLRIPVTGAVFQRKGRLHHGIEHECRHHCSKH